MVRTYFMLVAPNVFGSTADHGTGLRVQNRRSALRIVVLPDDRRDIVIAEDGWKSDESQRNVVHAGQKEGIV